jgi:hypothetical protein
MTTPKLPTFQTMVQQVTKGCGTNTRAIAISIMWAGERIAAALAKATADNQETHEVRQMSQELGRAFIESIVPPAPEQPSVGPSKPVPGVQMPAENRSSVRPRTRTTSPPRK